MLVSTAFDRRLRLPSGSVIDVGFTAAAVIVTVRLRRGGACARAADRLAGSRSTAAASSAGATSTCDVA
jgi:hypothetical protein